MNNRSRGDYFERQVRDALRAAGWYVIRSAGSQGAADLIALRAGNTPLLVQCKLGGRISRPERQALLDAAFGAGGRPIVALRPQGGRIQLLAILESHRLAPLDLLRVPTRPQPPARRLPTPVPIQRAGGPL